MRHVSGARWSHDEVASTHKKISILYLAQIDGHGQRHSPAGVTTLPDMTPAAPGPPRGPPRLPPRAGLLPRGPAPRGPPLWPGAPRGPGAVLGAIDYYFGWEATILGGIETKITSLPELMAAVGMRPSVGSRRVYILRRSVQQGHAA